MRSRIVLGICITLLLTGSLSAADTNFTGATNNLWSNADNWSNGIPGEADKAKLLNGVTCVLDYDAGLVKHIQLGKATSSLQLVDGALVGVQDWTQIALDGGEEDNRHLMEVLGGVFNANYRIMVGNKGYGHLVIDYSGVVNLNAQFLRLGWGANGDGLVELRGGSLNLLTDSALPLSFRNGTNSTAKMDFSGGVMTQAFSDARLAVVNDHIADGTITAYGGVGTVLVDTGDANDVITVKGLHPRNPVPEDGGNVPTGNITLSWTLPDPCVPGQPVPVDVYFTDDLEALQMFTDPAAIRIVSKQNVTSTTMQVQKKTRYYWAVDTYEGTDNDPVWGQIFDFYVDNLEPVVKADSNVTTWLDNGSVDVAIAAAVTDADPTTTLWTVITEPNEGMAVIANPDQTETTVTLSALGTYVLQLEADDGEYKGADTLTINVFSDHCEAAKSLPGWTPSSADINQDCVVDELDEAILLENWLQCTGLDCPDPNAL